MHVDGVEWDGSLAGALGLQERLERQVVLRDGFAKPLAMVAGLVVMLEERSRLRAEAVLMDARQLSEVERFAIQGALPSPREARLTLFHALQALLEVARMLPTVPDLAFVAAQGVPQPHRFGIASYFGAAAGIPAIGVGLDEPTGDAAPLHQIRGAYTPLRVRGEQVGWLLRSKEGCDALAVSPGHKVAMASAADLVMRFVDRHRLPEPLRAVTRLGSPNGSA